MARTRPTLDGGPNPSLLLQVNNDGRLSRAGGHGGAVGEERLVDVVPLGCISCYVNAMSMRGDTRTVQGARSNSSSPRPGPPPSMRTASACNTLASQATQLYELVFSVRQSRASQRLSIALRISRLSSATGFSPSRRATRALSKHYAACSSPTRNMHLLNRGGTDCPAQPKDLSWQL